MAKITKDIANVVCWFAVGLLFVFVPTWISGSSKHWVVGAFAWLVLATVVLAASNVRDWWHSRNRASRPKHRRGKQ